MTDVCMLDAASVPVLRDQLAAAPRIALDTEFHTEGKYVPELFLVQLRTDDGPTWVIDPLQRDVFTAIAPSIAAVPTWIAHGCQQDIRLMARALGSVPERILDTQVVAAMQGDRYPMGLDGLAQRHIGAPIDKAVRMSDWSTRPLPEEQIAYAAADVAWLMPLWDTLWARAEALGRADAVELACAELRARCLQPDGFRGDWHRIVGGGSIDPAGVRVLRALLTWREQEARGRDRPPHFVLGDATLRELAKSRPRTVAALANHRRLADRTIRKLGDALVGTIRAAEDAEDDGVRSIRRGSADARRFAWLELWAEVHASTEQLGAGLVMPQDTLRSLVLTRTSDRSGVREALGGWRDALVGDAITNALSGRAALSLTPTDVSGSCPTPERGKAEDD